VIGSDAALVAVERARREVEAAYLAVLDRADDTKRFDGVELTQPAAA